MKNPTLDAGIPVLTEVIASQQTGLDAESEPAPPAAAAAIPAVQEAEHALTLQERATTEWDEEQWNRLEREIRERVLHQVLDRIDFVLEQRVRDSLADVLQTAVEGLASEIKDGLHQTVKEVITRAVTQEISKLQSSKK